MKRNVTDVLRRSFESTLTNWPLILVRIAETILALTIIIGAVIITIIPFLVSAGLTLSEDMRPDEIADTIAARLVQNWVLIIYALGVITIVFGVLIAIHSFVEGATARILVDSERANRAYTFSLGRWFSGGASSWWRVFWIYNAIWSVAGLVLLIPLTATLAAMLLVTSTGGRVALGCGGLAITVLVLLPTAVLCAMWTQKAIAIALGREAGAMDSMRAARRELAADFGRHIVVAILVMAASIAGSMVISMIGWPISMVQVKDASTMFGVVAPIQFVISFLQSIFSSAVATWFLAAYISMTEEK